MLSTITIEIHFFWITICLPLHFAWKFSLLPVFYVEIRKKCIRCRMGWNDVKRWTERTRCRKDCNDVYR